MKFAVVAGGWHWPAHFYRAMAFQQTAADLFVVAHRSPELPIVREEKLHILATAAGDLGHMDRELYAEYPTLSELKSLGWQYQDAPNTVGDWGFFNQWLESHDYRDYDVILNCHDDTYIRSRDLFSAAENWWKDNDLPWLILANGMYPQAPASYVRGSFEFWKREMLDMIGGRFDLGNIPMTREGKTDTPEDWKALLVWNDTCLPLRDFMTQRKLSNRIAYLSPHYRISRWAIEGERGFLHYSNGAPWSLEAGLKAFA